MSEQKTLRELCEAAERARAAVDANETDETFSEYAKCAGELADAVGATRLLSDIGAALLLAHLDAEREAGRAEERDRLMARLRAIGADAIESYRRSRTPRAEGGMDALLTAADILADTLNGRAGSGTEVAR